MKNNLSLFVVTHKQINTDNYPGRKIIYVGNNNLVADNIKTFKDNTGDNISNLNPIYCELTALYWIWKNYKDSEYVGIEHYRRCFYKGFKIAPVDYLYNKANKTDFLHFQRFYHLFSEKTRFSHYQGKGVYKLLEKSISIAAPEYLDFWRKQMKKWYNTSCNIFICKKEHFDKYMEFLFKVLKEAEKHLDELSDQERPRAIGYMAERLFDTYINFNHYKHKGNLVVLTNRYKIK